jgi:hypothetical protein
MTVRGAARLAALGLGVLTLGGCQLYWLKPGADMAAFTADHQSCVKTAGAPVREDWVMVNVDFYRACMRSHGWQRETGSKMGNPAGYYRGQENEGPVRLGDVPRQTPTVESSRR